jgi:hypothetical protein
MFDSRRYQIFCEVVGLERGPLSLVSTTEELLGRNSSDSSVEVREYGRRDASRWPSGTLYPQKVGTNLADKRGSLGGIVRSRTQPMDFLFFSVKEFSLIYPQGTSKTIYFFLTLLLAIRITQIE